LNDGPAFTYFVVRMEVVERLAIVNFEAQVVNKRRTTSMHNVPAKWHRTWWLRQF